MATDTAYQTTKRMPAGVYGRFTGTLCDAQGTALPASSIDSYTLSLETESGTTINGRDGLTNPAPNVTIQESGGFLWEIQEEDSSIQDVSSVSVGQIERHVAVLTWTYPSTPTKTGIMRIILECERLS